MVAREGDRGAVRWRSCEAQASLSGLDSGQTGMGPKRVASGDAPDIYPNALRAIPATVATDGLRIEGCGLWVDAVIR